MTSERAQDRKKPRRANGTSVIEACIARGNCVRYARKAALPALEVQVLIQEVAREELGILERAVLALVGDGVRALDALSLLLGIAPHRLGGFLRDFVQRGLLCHEHDLSFSLSKNGQMSLDRGSVVVDASHALLLSGLTGELLPRSAYAAQRFTAQELAQAHCYVLPEQPTISLDDLDLNRFPDKRAYNLPEEARRILSIEGEARPFFVECFLVVFDSGPRHEVGAEIWFSDAKLKSAPIELISPYLEPFGLESPQGAKGALASLARAFSGAGAVVDEAKLDSLGNPILTLSRLGDEVPTWQCFGRSLAYYVGTAGQKSRPMAELRDGRGKWDKEIQGHSLYLQSLDETWRASLELFRRLHLVLDECYADATARTTREQIREKLARVCPLDAALALAQRLDDRRLLGQLDRKPEPA